MQLALYRVAQEALTNVRRHSAAVSARVHVGVAADRVTLTVEDDGPPQAAATTTGTPTHRLSEGSNAGAGFGLQGMRERVRIYGGTIDCGGDGPGFTVRASVPLGEAS